MSRPLLAAIEEVKVRANHHLQTGLKSHGGLPHTDIFDIKLLFEQQAISGRFFWIIVSAASPQ